MKLIRQLGKVDRIVDQAGITFKVPFIEDVSTLPNTVLLDD